MRRETTPPVGGELKKPPRLAGWGYGDFFGLILLYDLRKFG